MISSPPIQWYPGHIAKAEKQLQDQLKRVDVVLEVLDARVPLASQHPDVPQWVGEKPRILVFNRMDMIPPSLHSEWKAHFKQQGEQFYLTNAKQGKGVKAILKAAQKAGEGVNERRKKRGMRSRPVRAVVIGFPNVGKSALINRLVGRKAVKSARRAGVTRQLQWVRISDQIELLDAPGVIPWKLENQDDAVKLAICEDIGEAAYDNQRVAAILVDLLVDLGYGEILKSRYGLDPMTGTGENFVEQLACDRYKNDKERVAVLLLNDFRKGNMGQIPLELPE
ncbi:ribosome biogenesis GTPase YlqF [Spirulina sp. CS-785/01]|uniref:ribosome biogenesis GTPase YlqF n=1 Tax=Spirulina sp. CS-785/01 TaxID=3021716 RepID=UPI0023310160|nr:ribosome biogenesis GTPase YlqF [Spirulina sp. CS-785/01]MDB9315570.1 ribosome biogenesis GTPase YlqF [Spirulina sp. CS-785/01]